MQNSLLAELYVFDVWAWQCMFFNNCNNKIESCMIDCWYSKPLNSALREKTPLEFLIDNWLIPRINGYCFLWNLIITNYDFDHFKWLKNLTENVLIWNVLCSNNISTNALKNLKWDQWENNSIFECLYRLKNNSSNNDINLNDYEIIRLCISSERLLTNIDTNNLSQLVFIKIAWNLVLIPWDLEEKWWKLLFEEYGKNLMYWILDTDVYVASHHWRENWLPTNVRTLLSHNNLLKCIIISDKTIEYWTQEWMTSIYNSLVKDGIVFSKNTQRVEYNTRNLITTHETTKRKVLTTRNDWNFLLSFWSSWEIIARPFNIWYKIEWMSF